LLSVLQPKKLVRACISDGGVWIDWTTRYGEAALHGWILLEAIPEFFGGDSVWNYCGGHCTSCNHNCPALPAVAQIVAQLLRGQHRELEPIQQLRFLFVWFGTRRSVVQILAPDCAKTGGQRLDPPDLKKQVPTLHVPSIHELD